jgi:hypothetical protein
MLGKKFFHIGNRAVAKALRVGVRDGFGVGAERPLTPANPPKSAPMNSQQELPDVPREQRAAAELIKRIRKLRWMGLEEEAHRMVRASLRVCSNDVLAVKAPKVR